MFKPTHDRRDSLRSAFSSIDSRLIEGRKLSGFVSIARKRSVFVQIGHIAGDETSDHRDKPRIVARAIIVILVSKHEVLSVLRR